jgi:nucleoid-associated protein YgaU
MTTELENFASSLADRVELELEGEARRNFEAAQEREQLRRAAQAAQPAAAAPVAAPVAEAPPAALPGWEDAQ